MLYDAAISGRRVPIADLRACEDQESLICKCRAPRARTSLANPPGNITSMVESSALIAAGDLRDARRATPS